MSEQPEHKPSDAANKVDVLWPAGSNKQTTLSLVDLASAAVKSVVRVCGTDIDKTKSWDCGSGFVIESGGQDYVITNNHVVDTMGVMSTDPSKKTLAGFEIIAADGTKLGVDKIATDKPNDLAALHLKSALPASMKALTLGSTTSLYAGTELAAAGYSFGTKLSLSPGVMSGKILLRDIASQLSTKIPVEADRNRLMIETDGLTNTGESGGPMLNRKKEAVGVETYTDGKRTSIGATAEEIKALLANGMFKELK